MGLESDTNADVSTILDLERRILRALFATAVSAHDRDAVMSKLAAHKWSAPEHRVVYESVTRMRSRDAAALRAELPSIATRMGFPDVDWNEYFGRDNSADTADVAQLVGRLTAASAGASGKP